jgi:hypothetical protein
VVLGKETHHLFVVRGRRQPKQAELGRRGGSSSSSSSRGSERQGQQRLQWCGWLLCTTAAAAAAAVESADAAPPAGASTSRSQLDGAATVGAGCVSLSFGSSSSQQSVAHSKPHVAEPGGTSHSQPFGAALGWAASPTAVAAAGSWQLRTQDPHTVHYCLMPLPHAYPCPPIAVPHSDILLFTAAAAAAAAAFATDTAAAVGLQRA